MKLSHIPLVTPVTANAGKEPTTTPVLVNAASPSYMHKIGGFQTVLIDHDNGTFSQCGSCVLVLPCSRTV